MNTSTETCPSLEDLAAFLEGRLSGDKRARIVAHLADCPDCYEIFAEAARFELSEEGKVEDPDPPAVIEVPREPMEDPPAGKVIPFPSRPVFRWVSSIAAVLAMVALGIPLYKQYYTMPQINSAELVTPAVSEKAAEDPFWSDFAERGSGDDAGSSTIPHEVLLGAHALNLRLSLSRDDQDRALNDLAGINDHIGKIGLLPDQTEAYLRIQTQIADGKPARQFLREADRIEATLPVEEDPYFALGKWVEAGRLAALAENPEFFQASENRKFLRAFLHHERKDLEPDVETDLKEIRKTLSKADPSSLPYQELQQQFAEILTFYQNKSKEDLVPAGPSSAP